MEHRDRPRFSSFVRRLQFHSCKWSHANQRPRLAKSENACELWLTHLGDYGVNILCEDDMLDELLRAGWDTVLLLDPVLWSRSNQYNQHGLTGHVHLKHTDPHSTSLLRDTSITSNITGITITPAAPSNISTPAPTGFIRDLIYCCSDENLLLDSSTLILRRFLILKIKLMNIK